MTRTNKLKQHYHLLPHEEGGFFAEAYTAPFEQDGRSICGSIYFLLENSDISHFHEIDCDEVWYYHEGCGMRITMLHNHSKQEFILNEDNVMVVLPKGSIFAAENIDKNSYTFVSCVTTPKFTYDGFRLVYKKEIQDAYPEFYEAVEYLAYS